MKIKALFMHFPSKLGVKRVLGSFRLSRLDVYSLGEEQEGLGEL